MVLDQCTIRFYCISMFLRYLFKCHFCIFICLLLIIQIFVHLSKLRIVISLRRRPNTKSSIWPWKSCNGSQQIKLNYALIEQSFSFLNFNFLTSFLQCTSVQIKRSSQSRNFNYMRYRKYRLDLFEKWVIDDFYPYSQVIW